MYKLDWSLPDDANVRRAVGSFEVIIDLVAPDHSEETLFSTVYHTNVRGNHTTLMRRSWIDIACVNNTSLSCAHTHIYRPTVVQITTTVSKSDTMIRTIDTG